MRWVVKPEVGKLKALQKFPRPTTCSKNRFVVSWGLPGTTGKFIPNHGIAALPLIDLTRKDPPSQVQWSEVCGNTFQQLKG